MRGKGKGSVEKKIYAGITPAYAGKSEPPAGCYTYRQDHPRLCGEKSEVQSVRLGRAGSPPPMRGKAGKAWQENNQSRITPAYAGKSVPENSTL